MPYEALRIDGDPTTWELKKPLPNRPTTADPVTLKLRHPFKGGTLVLSPNAARSTVFLVHGYGTRPNGIAIGGGPVLYVPSPHGPDVHSNPPNFYHLSGISELEAETDLKKLAEGIKEAMRAKKFFPVPIELGEVVISGAKIPFVVICPPNLKETGDT